MNVHKGWYSRNYLPHLDAPDLFQAITFRLNDSLPQNVVRRLESQVKAQQITDAEKRRRIEAYLDAGHGACWLRQPAVAQLVQDALLHFDGQRYRLLAWCIMPNHVHTLIETFEGCPLSKIVQSWKSFTAQQANRLLDQQGRFWQRDYFDRYVRDAEHYERLISYIENNPVKANLVERAGDWRLGSAFTRSFGRQDAGAPSRSNMHQS
jgi:REP element-mobilizing transposase RayT